jgi:Na+/serine symporter
MLVDNFILAILEAAFLGILATGMGAQVLSLDRVTARYRLGEDVSDAIVKVCFSLIVPLFTTISIFAPNGLAAQDFRNSATFHEELIAVTGFLEVLIIISAIKAIRKWRRG